MRKFLDKIIEYGTLLFIFLLPYQARWILSGGQINGGYWEYGTQSLHVTEILLAVILVAIIIKFIARAVETQNFASLQERFNFKRLLSPAGAILLFLIYAGLSVFWAIDKNTALIHWRWLAEAAAVILLLSAKRDATTGPSVQNKIQWAIILSAVIQAMWGIGQFLLQTIPASTILGIARQGAEVLGASVVETLDGRWLRAYGSFPHPNMLGGWLVLGLIVILSVAKRSRRIPAINHETPRQARGDGLKEILLSLSFVIILFGLLATFSRAAWVAFGVFIVFWFFREIKKRNWTPAGVYPREARAGMTTIVLIVIIFNSLFPNLLGARIDSQNRLEAKASSERLVGFSQSWQIIKNHPLAGVGVGNYGLAVQRDIDSTKPAYYYQPVHNVFLLIWAELGIVGLLLILLIVFLSGLLRGVYAEYSRPRNDMIFVLPVIIIALFDHYLWSLYSGLMIGAVYLANISRK